MIVSKGTNASVNALGTSDGVAVANRRPQHRHTPHTHTVNGRTNSAAVFFDAASAQAAGFTALSVSSADGGSGVATDSLDAPAFMVLNYIIKL